LTDVLSILLDLIVGGLIVGVLGYVALLWYKQHSKPCDGVQMAPYEIRGRIGLGRTFEPFYGNLVEVTDFFFVSKVKASFEPVIAEINKRISNIPDASQKANLMEGLKTLDHLFLKNACRLYILGSGIWGDKDLFVQYGDVTKSLADYASHATRSRNSISFGPVTEHYVEGRIDSFPGRIETEGEFKQYGPFYIHMFLPFDRGTDAPSTEQLKIAEDVMKALSGLAHLIGYIPTSLALQNTSKVKDEAIKSLNIENHELQREVGAKTAEINLARKVMRNLQPDGKNNEMPNLGKFRAVDLVIQFICLLLFGALFGFLGGPTFVGVAVALIGSLVGYGVGLLLVSWRG
jgi:F0F1-type ATP synthase assembly protein I